MPRVNDGGDTYAPGTYFVYDPVTQTVTPTSPTPTGTSGNSLDVRDGSTESTPGPGGFVGGPGNPAPGPSPAPTPGPGPGPTGGGPPLDWSAYLANWGFPPEVINQLNTIFSTYSDPNQAAAASLAYIRGTDWYSQTFPGIQEGEKLGLINDEAGYRSYVNNLNDVYQRYQNRAVTSQEVADALRSGKNANQIDAHFQGQAYINANSNEFQYELGAFDPQGRATDQELSALGDQTAGLGNMLGPQLQARLDTAKQRMQRIFQGSLATPSLSLLNNGRLASSGAGSTTPDLPS